MQQISKAIDTILNRIMKAYEKEPQTCSRYHDLIVNDSVKLIKHGQEAIVFNSDHIADITNIVGRVQVKRVDYYYVLTKK